LTASQKRKLILILGAIAALGPLSIDMYLPSFPSIAGDLGVDISQISLTLTAYFIGISVGQLLYGPLIDRYGRKPPLLFGLALYTVAAVACALSQSLNQLIFFRLLLAFGGSVGMVSARAMVRDLFETKEVARVFSSLILVMGVAPILAPALGGILDEFLNWRFIFGFLSITGLLLGLIVHFRLSESKEADVDMSLNFGRILKRYGQVMLNKQFVVYGLSGSLAMAGLFTYIASSPLVLMENMGFESSTYTILFGINASLFIIGSQVNRWVLKYYSTIAISKAMALAALILCVGFISYSYANGFSPYGTSAFFGLFLFCFGFINPNTTALSLEPFDKMAGVASALVGSFRMAAGAVASALVSSYSADNITPIFWLMGSMALLIAVLVVFYKPTRTLATRAA
jgi:DHA1 family bicyclomycin/chloramphenicol resistance-like MFS transporter